MKPWKNIAITDPVTKQSVKVFRLEVLGFVLIVMEAFPNELGGIDRSVLLTSRAEKERNT